MQLIIFQIKLGMDLSVNKENINNGCLRIKKPHIFLLSSIIEGHAAENPVGLNS